MKIELEEGDVEKVTERIVSESLYAVRLLKKATP